MSERVQVGDLQVGKPLYDLVAGEIAPGTGIEPDAFWASLAKIVDDLGPKNQALLDKRAELQSLIDGWHGGRANQPHDAEAYQQFLQEIGYLLPQGEDFQISTENVDAEIRQIA